jgi:serine/threonine-protein kinase RsbT
MRVIETLALEVNSAKDIVRVRRELVSIAKIINMNCMKEAQLRTAATELLVNMVRYAGNGKVTVEHLEHQGLQGVRASFVDEGPGIVDIKAALKAGFSTGNSLGHGLSGCRNLVDSFQIDSAEGKGTSVVITKWN